MGSVLATVLKSWLRACWLLILLLLDDSDSGGSDSGGSDSGGSDSDSSGDSDSADSASSPSDDSGRRRPLSPTGTGVATEVTDQDMQDIPKR